MLAASTDVASVVGKGIAENQHPDRIAADAYQAIWGKQNRGQRDFQVRYLHHFMPRHLISLPFPSRNNLFYLCLNCLALSVIDVHVSTRMHIACKLTAN